MLPMYVKDARARMTQSDPKTGAPRWAPIPDREIERAVHSTSGSTRLTREGSKRTDAKDQITTLTDFTAVWIRKNIADLMQDFG